VLFIGGLIKLAQIRLMRYLGEVHAR